MSRPRSAFLTTVLLTDDSDIEIVEKKYTDVASLPGNNDICQLCSRNLSGLSTLERGDHHNGHLSGLKPTSSQSKRARPKPTSVNTTPMKSGKKEEDIFWYPAQAKSPPGNFSPGVLSVLKEALKSSYKKGGVQRAILCYERTPHILRESFDTGWGCGYRNFLMSCAALMDQSFQSIYFAHLDSPSPPGVRNLQHWIEDAWKNGYDDIGANELDHKLVDSKKKLGTGDLYIAYTSRRIPCVLVDFDLRNSPKGFDTLVEWTVNYFTEKPEGDINKILRAASPVSVTGKMPVIMQLDGHSVTIVGYELGKNGKYNLLVFDPSRKVPDGIRQAALNASTSVSLGKSRPRERSKSPVTRKRLRANEDPDDEVVSIHDSDNEKIDDARRAATLKSTLDPDAVIKAFRLKDSHKKKHEYQLLYFTMGDPLSDEEQNDRKVVFSVAAC